ncbi:MAG TPA: hypothetical protein VMB85_21560 [Bryobacteraceae bacterium]|nr:hypothetical protein [Bryobacteraceae bacterium]
MMLLLVLIAIIVLWNAPRVVEKAAERLRGWLGETHARHFELCRHFFLRFFDSDLISDPSQARVVAGGAIGILVSLSLIFGQAYYHKYRMLGSLDSPEPFESAVLGDVLFLVTLAMVAAALFTTLEWPALFPALRDYLALASLPVLMREIFAAKFLALLAVAIVVIAAAALPPSVIIPAMMSGPYAAGCGRHVPGIFVASVLGGWFVFFTLVAIQGALLNLLPVAQFPRVSLAVQGILLAALLAGLPFVFSIPTFFNGIAGLPAWSAYAPPFWFFAIDQLIFGAHDAAIVHLARIAAAALILSAAAAVANYLWSYRRHRIRVLEAPSLESAASRFSWPAAAGQRLVPGARALGVFSFTWKSLARSRQHRLILITFGAVAVALISEGFANLIFDGGLRTFAVASEGTREAVIAIPLALSLLLIGGLRYVFRLPVELRANWIFRITAPGHAMELSSAIELFLFYCGALPVAILTLPMETTLLGARTGLEVTLLCFLTSALLIEALLVSFEKIPFTSSYLPGRRTLIQTVIVCSIIAAGYIGGLAALVSLLIRSLTSGSIVAAILGAAWWTIRRARRDSHRNLHFEFEDRVETVVQLLGIERE